MNFIDLYRHHYECPKCSEKWTEVSGIALNASTCPDCNTLTLPHRTCPVPPARPKRKEKVT